VITLYGYSDDLIEIDGDISEEFTPLGEVDPDEPGDLGDLVAFSNGVVLRIKYRTCWRIELVAGQGLVEIVPCPEDDEESYSDYATITGPVEWVVCGNTFVKAEVKTDA